MSSGSSGTRHIGFLKHAEAFAQAASVIVESEKNEASKVLRPILYLYCHAIELALKSVLIRHGTTDKKLKKISHDLAKAFCRACKYEEMKFLSSDLRSCVEQLNPYYSGKHLEYHRTGMMHVCDPDSLRKLVDNFIKDLDGHYKALSQAKSANARSTGNAS